MNKEQFLTALRARLTGLPREDLERTLQYYREMIDDRIEEGMSEQAAVADVGDPDELAAAILQRPVRRTQIQAAKASAPMSAGKRAALIVCAVLLIIAGISLILGATNLGKGRDGSVKEYTFANAGIRALELDTGAAAVDLRPAKDGICRVQCVESATLKYKVWLNEGTLHIEREPASRWFFFRVSLKEDYVRVWLPEREYESLWVKTSSGGVSVPEDFCFRTAIISASSGGVGFAADVTDELNIQTSSGGVAVAGASPKELFIHASSGGVALSDMQPGNVTLSLSSGGLRLSDVHCSGDLSAEDSSGSIRFSDVIADGTMTLECTSGSIKLEDCDAAELRIQCVSGSVSGHLLTPKTYIARSVSGSVRVPPDSGGGICNVNTTSGSIRFD